MQKFTQYNPAEKNTKTEVEQTDAKGDSSGEAELKQNVDIFCWGKFFSFCFSFSHLPVIVNSFSFRSPLFP